MKSIVVVALLVTFAPAAQAECIAPPPPDYVQVKVLACSSAEKLVNEKIAGKSHSDSEKRHLNMNIQYLAIADVELIADVEIITSHTRDSHDIYKGKITPIESNRMKTYMMLGTPPASCDEFYKGKTLLVNIDPHPFSCCRDMPNPDKNEVAPQCLIGLPRIWRWGLELDDLQSAEVRVLPESTR